MVVLYFLSPKESINDYLFPVPLAPEYGEFSKLEDKFEASYSGNNPMMFNKLDLSKIKSLISKRNTITINEDFLAENKQWYDIYYIFLKIL